MFTWRNPLRSAAIAAQPGCPLQARNARFICQASIGSGVSTILRFEFRNAAERMIHSYFWRHASPAARANGGYGCHPEGGLAPGACQRESAWLAWRGPLTITVDLVQFADGSVWLTSDPRSAVRQSDLEAGTRAAADHLIRVYRAGGMSALIDALPLLHRDVITASRPGSPEAMTGFYAGLTRAGVLARRLSGGDVEGELRAMR